MILNEEKIVFNNTQEIIDAIKSKTVGAKVDPSFVQSADSLDFDSFFERAKQSRVNNVTYGVQFLLSHSDVNTYKQAISHDALYAYLNSKQKAWAKQLPIFAEFERSKYNPKLWQDFENAIMSEEQKHGKKRLTAENQNEVKTVCTSGDWVLYMPLSYKGECAVAKDNAGNAGWCTRQENQYNRYTYNGKTHLYVLRNKQTGEAYQFAFMKDSVEIFNSVNGVEHAYSCKYRHGHYDYDPDESDLSLSSLLKKIPDDILKNIKDEHEKKGRTLFDFKTNVINNTQKETYGEPEHVSGNIYKVRIYNYNYRTNTANEYFSHKNLSEENYFNY